MEKYEIWKDCKGYEGKYQVSNRGRVWSVYKQRVMKPYMGNGYLKVDLIAKNGKRKKEYVHRLVALAFIDNLNNHPIVNHIDGNKQNNLVENLEWITQQKNMQHSYYILNNTTGTSHIPRKCFCIETGVIYPSISEAKRQTGASHISEVCSGKQKTSGGYHWRYCDE